MSSTVALRKMTIWLWALAVVWASGAPLHAHEGHAGDMMVFVETSEALRAMLPEDAKLSRRKERLDGEAAARAERAHEVDLDTRIHTYYLARDRSTEQVIAAAIMRKVPYRHGEIEVGLGLDDQGRITRAALTGGHEKYQVDFEGTTGVGFLEHFEGMTVDELVAEARALDETTGRPTRTIVEALRDAAVLLDAFMENLRNL